MPFLSSEYVRISTFVPPACDAVKSDWELHCGKPCCPLFMVKEAAAFSKMFSKFYQNS